MAQEAMSQEEEHVVKMCAQTVKYDFFRGPLKDCEEICRVYKWEYKDENQFVWSLEID